MEKHCFTPNPEESHHSSGAYYFRSGELLKRYTRELLDSGNTINGEYYVSMLFPLMLRDGHLITVPEMSHFMQWGTPEDLEEYEAWSRRIHTDLQKKKGRTHIPAEREPHVQIPYGESTAEFKKSYAYWSEHFRSI
jgi:NDP-sugar pyrophosphorylase family protein